MFGMQLRCTGVPPMLALASLTKHSVQATHAVLGAGAATGADPYFVLGEVQGLGVRGIFSRRLRPVMMRWWAVGAFQHRAALARLESWCRLCQGCRLQMLPTAFRVAKALMKLSLEPFTLCKQVVCLFGRRCAGSVGCQMLVRRNKQGIEQGWLSPLRSHTCCCLLDARAWAAGVVCTDVCNLHTVCMWQCGMSMRARRHMWQLYMYACVKPLDTTRCTSLTAATCG
ncbi:hypothetical protein COO60DRAFT_1480509 [Scenedesmus sp. NREL 46B-D3]|nr:hypothetical protein COO60DRAFT_1480509 [Scenedesmus sp. NREL 46B-D3]